MPISESGMGTRMTKGTMKLSNQPTTSTKISTSTAAKARPRSRNTSRVMCHSPSHFMMRFSVFSGWARPRRTTGAPAVPNT